MDDETPPVWSRSEVRVGGFLHAIPLGRGQEYGGVDLSAELLLPRPSLWTGSFWRSFAPRPDIGFALNFDHKTSYAYVGGAWTASFERAWFVEPAVGLAVHNGKFDAPLGQDRLSLGCNPVFRLAFSAGYRITPRWALTASMEHLSNGGLCSPNQSLNEVGPRLSLAF